MVYNGEGDSFQIKFKDGNKTGISLGSEKLQSMASSIADARAKNLTYSVIVNKTQTYSGAYTIKADELGFTDSGFYVHVFISKKTNSDEHSYFTPKTRRIQPMMAPTIKAVPLYKQESKHRMKRQEDYAETWVYRRSAKFSTPALQFREYAKS